MSSTGTWVYIDRYRLKSESLEGYLVEQFPNVTITIQQRENDEYAVQLPQALSQAQRDRIEQLRTPRRW
ncbi:hypothetical protein SCAR479_00317 [Seiridium cardinale]|uniref:Uncharacterized protein n=1 Tax=Seiridium cardinale TaxID=138064 RepID=A0ABR2Y9J6_9PEZI